MYCDRRLGGSERWSFFPPDDAAMRIPPQFLRTICYIGHFSGGEDVLEGTGFFIGVPAPDSKNPAMPDRSLYVVTAKHVADRVDSNFWIRINQQDGTSIPINGDGLEWHHHPAWSDNNQIDVAVCLIPYSKKLDLIAPEPSIFVMNPAEQGIGIGDEAFVIGLFTNLSGSKRNTPIARTGNLAMLPEEKIPTDENDKKGEMEAYLLEVRSYGGMSGAPVFIRETEVSRVTKVDTYGIPYLEETEVAGGGRIWLIGLMHGHWEVDNDQIRTISAQHDEADAMLNLGIALVVPAYQINETLEGPKCVEERERELAKLRAGKPSRLVRDSATKGGPDATPLPAISKREFLSND
jgi:hypothetical protein